MEMGVDGCSLVTKLFTKFFKSDSSSTMAWSTMGTESDLVWIETCNVTN